MTSLPPSRVTLSPELEAATRVFRDVGAVSPADARPLTAMPGVDSAAVIALVARGLVREAESGCYYLYPGSVHERRQGILTAVLIAASGGAILVGLPLIAWHLTR